MIIQSLYYICKINTAMRTITYLIFLFTSMTIAQSNVKAFQAGENLIFTASYNRSGLMTDLAQITMQTSEIKTSKSTLLRLKCTARTYSKWDNFFKIRDLYESYVNPNTLTPYLYKREIDEGGHYKFTKYTFNHRNRTVKSLRRQKSKNFESGFWDRNETLNFNSGTKDLVTTLYHIRTLDIHKATVGNTDSFTFLFDGKQKILNLTLLEIETIKTNLGNKKCYKLAITINDSNALRGHNSNLIWLTADENKIPVYAKFKIAVGSGELRIQSATGLKN